MHLCRYVCVHLSACLSATFEYTHAPYVYCVGAHLGVYVGVCICVGLCTAVCEAGHVCCVCTYEHAYVLALVHSSNAAACLLHCIFQEAMSGLLFLRFVISLFFLLVCT